MERRIYQGEFSPAELADFLVRHYEPQDDLQAQHIGQGDTFAVQIGRGDVPEELRHAVTVAITPLPQGEDGSSGVAVTLGQQQWFTSSLATSTAVISLVGALVTPWALFGLIWPLSQAVSSTTLPADIWSTIDTYVLSHGGTLSRSEELSHPHFGL